MRLQTLLTKCQQLKARSSAISAFAAESPAHPEKTVGSYLLFRLFC